MCTCGTQSNDQNTSHTQSAMLAGPTGKHHCETNTRDSVIYTLSMQCAGTVHVTSYLNFLLNSVVCHYGISWMFAKSFCRASVPSPQTDHWNVLQNPSLGSQPVWTGSASTLALLTIYERRMYHIHVSTCDILFFCVGRCEQWEETQSVSDTPQQRMPTYIMRMNANECRAPASLQP